LDSKNLGGQTALHLTETVAVQKPVVEVRGQHQQKDKDGNKPLHVAFQDVAPRSNASLEFLLDHGASVLARNHEGLLPLELTKGPLRFHVNAGTLHKRAKRLLKSATDTEEVDTECNTILHAVVTILSRQSAQHFPAREGAFVNHLACSRICAILMNRKNQRNESALDLALKLLGGSTFQNLSGESICIAPCDDIHVE
jgi:hypothetical protein